MKSSFTNTCLLLFKLFTCNDYVDKIVLQCLSAGATSAAAPSPPSAGLAANSKDSTITRFWYRFNLEQFGITDLHTVCHKKVDLMQSKESRKNSKSLFQYEIDEIITVKRNWDTIIMWLQNVPSTTQSIVGQEGIELSKNTS